MAKRKKKRFAPKRRRSSSRAPFKKRSSRKRKSGLGGLMGAAVGAGLYGAGREKVSDMLAPYTSRIPLGTLSDEAGMAALSYLLATGKIPLVNKVPMSRDVGKAGWMIEWARIGARFADGSWRGATSSAGPAKSGELF